MILFWCHHPLLGRHLLAVGREWSWISSEEVHCPVCTKLSNVSQYLVLKNELYLFIYLQTWWISTKSSMLLVGGIWMCKIKPSIGPVVLEIATWISIFCQISNVCTKTTAWKVYTEAFQSLVHKPAKYMLPTSNRKGIADVSIICQLSWVSGMYLTG